MATTPDQIKSFVTQAKDYVRRIEDEEIVIEQIKGHLLIDVSRLIVPTIAQVLSFAARQLDFTGWAKSEKGILTIFYK